MLGSITDKDLLDYTENIINTVREPLITLDQDLRVVTVNRSFYNFFKVKPENTIGQLIYELGNKQWDIPALRELLETILLQNTCFHDYEVEHYFTSIGRRTMLLNARQIERAEGRELIVLLAIEDITERKELAFQNEENNKWAEELALANKELAFQNEEKEKRASELALANKELAFQNEEKEKRAGELALANTELAFQNEEKEKRAGELALANTELAFQNEEKEKRADELALANTELAFQNEEKEKRADELALANTELAFQNEEKEKRADELALANTELAFQNEEKDKRAEELILANKEKEKRADELVLANKEKEKRADELVLANKELAFQTELDGYRSEKERVAQDLTLLIDTANAPIFGIDAEGNVNEWNQKSAEITGFNAEEVLGKNLVEEFIRADHRESVNDVLQKALKGDNTSNFEFPLYTKDNNLVRVLLNATTRRNANGDVVGVVGVGQDITELDGYRSEMERVAEDLTLLIDTANAPIFGIDAQGNVNEWNQKSAEITGFNADEVRGKNLVEEFISPDYRESVNDVLQKALKGDNTSNYEFPLYTKGNNLVRVLLNATTRRNANGDVVGVVGVGQDITELDSYRSEMERVAEDLTLLIDTANAPIFGIDAQGNVNEWNKKTAEITGFNAEEALGKNLVEEFIRADYSESVNDVLQKALKGENTSNYELLLYTKNNNLVTVLLNATTRRSTKGNVVGVIGVGQDITDRKFAEAQVIQASKLATLGEMATSVAHELNQPLHVIRLSSGNVIRKLQKKPETLEPAYLTQKLERIMQQTERASAIIDHMRMFGRKASEDAYSVDLCLTLNSALSLVSEQLRLAEIDVVINTPNQCSAVLGHQVQLEQVFLNLLTNAQDAIKSLSSCNNKVIKIDVVDTTKNIEITVENIGPQIPEAIIERIFEPFYTTKEIGKGTGLGLSVSYGIVRDMKGEISVTNTEHGVSFLITLPIYHSIN
ncbi:MAG: PAS domain S-box-containing protein [Colwellia sp.]|jgi:PAS domain S-box-containing protein